MDHRQRRQLHQLGYAIFHLFSEPANFLPSDVSVSGSAWNAAGSPSLAHLIRRTAHDVPHPTDAGRTLWDARTDVGPFTNGRVDADAAQVYNASWRAQSDSTGIYPLGSGSDFTAFLQRLGVRLS